MIRRPPRSTLFPTRRSSDLGAASRKGMAKRRDALPQSRHPESRRLRGDGEAGPHRRSEEHTSELQSRQYPVCRLLLEKKKNSTVDLIPLNPFIHTQVKANVL